MTPPPEENHVDDPLGGVDPLKWLESLAARQGANPEEFLTSADLDVPEVDPASVVLDEPGYVPYDPLGGARKAAAPEPKPVAEPPPAAPQPVAPRAGGMGDPLGGDIDPMAWLESLARRQGANPEEFVTRADLDVPEVDPASVVIDEPGYVPYDPSGGLRRPAESEAAPLEAKGREEPVPAEAASLLDPLSSDVDPIMWLESLARRQGAKAEELMTAANLDIPVPTGVVIDEPGYVPYSPFGPERLEEEPEYTAPEPPPVPELEEEAALSAGDTLAWLEGLAAEQGAVEAVAEVPAPADPLAGMADNEIEIKAARGELTQPQMEAWLARQADSFARHRAEAERAAVEEELPPAEPAEVPAWLQEARPVPGAPPEPAPLVEEIVEPPEPAELRDWLAEAPVEPAAGLADWLAEAAPEEAAAPVAEVPPEAPEEVPPGILPVAPPVAPPEPMLVGQYQDPWAAALDEEFMTQRMERPPEEPEWYTTALQDLDRQAALEAELAEQEARQVEEVEAGPEEEIEVAPAGELPDWLASMAPPAAAAEVGAAAEPELVEAGLPDWLTEAIPEVSGDEIADWLRTQEVGAEVEAEAGAEEAVLDWLAEAPPAPAQMPDWLAEAAPDEMLAAQEAAVEPALELSPADTAALLGVGADELTPLPAPSPALPSAPPPAPPPAPEVKPIPEAEPAPPAKPAARPALVTMPVPIVAELPAGEAYAAWRARLQQDPQNHPARLDLARTLTQHDDLASCLGQYQALVQSQALLDEVTADLKALVEAHPATPQARRVLGDALVRQGRLQDALDAYRAALEQL